MARTVRGLRSVPVFLFPLCLALLASCGQERKASNSNNEPPPVSLTAGQRAYLKAHGPLVYAPDPAFPPFESFDGNGNAVGISPDLLRMAARNIGAEIKTVRYPSWSGIIEAVKEGKVG